MHKQTAIKIVLSERQRKVLEKMAKGTHTPLHFIERAKIILLSAQEVNNCELARRLSLSVDTVKRWRKRWSTFAVELEQVETHRPHALKAKIEAALTDEQRSGRPSAFTAEEVAHILTLACQTPESLELPFSHWTPGLLAREAVKRGIVSSISTRQVGRFLKRSGLETPSSERMAQSEDR
ncbi:helix-turn-helix domain-containing protein [Fodinisporobacter ferrooxydans]|uniref:Helix-turn-helix domain-containing protein n=1 Tax=Fodinisporobacter ferrooxydans TaxID=2901836 RepID=A0ABY4CL38_9BACL|nr:helix-turn-helix domain-containing protein [Alicyclobacillaceae bacterium MYW30-H2]UOF90205.1 helix-turn-helix domain-containing protein [Alicyclobacillaceae bacterium MYW30-H2]UOF91044.1 helix-turn-helix domain-containing protein [Alicyclobacillaceae bacterium MYW30-H2]